jgi:hypothetical protein
MKRIFYLTLISCFLFATSCAKKIEDVNPDYFGYWENIDGGGYKTFDINTGTSSYMSFEGIKTISVTGRARVKKNESKLKISFKGFKIDTPPYENSYGYYNMVVEGVTYERY